MLDFDCNPLLNDHGRAHRSTFFRAVGGGPGEADGWEFLALAVPRNGLSSASQSTRISSDPPESPCNARHQLLAVDTSGYIASNFLLVPAVWLLHTTELRRSEPACGPSTSAGNRPARARCRYRTASTCDSAVSASFGCRSLSLEVNFLRDLPA